LSSVCISNWIEIYISSIPYQKAWAVNAMTISLKGKFNYIFPPFHLLHSILHKIRENGFKIILIAPTWPKTIIVFVSSPMFVRKTASSSLESGPSVSVQGIEVHQRLAKLHLHAWLLSGLLSDWEAFQK
jgi:hypothetical protein